MFYYILAPRKIFTDSDDFYDQLDKYRETFY